MEGIIKQIGIDSFDQCDGIWDMKKMTDITEVWREEMLKDSRIVFVFDCNGKYIAEGALLINSSRVGCTIQGSRIYLAHLIVLPEYQSNGIGTSLVAHMISWAYDNGYKEITVEVHPDNAAALHIYKKLGFNKLLISDNDEHGSFLRILKHI